MKIKNKRVLAGGTLIAVSVVGLIVSIMFLAFNIFGLIPTANAVVGKNKVVLENGTELSISDINEFIMYNSPNTQDAERPVYVNEKNPTVAKSKIKEIIIAEGVTAMYVPNFLSGAFYGAENLTKVDMGELEIVFDPEAEKPVTSANDFFKYTFAECPKLTEVNGLPSLPLTATDLIATDNYFTYTFQNAKSLTNVSALPALPENMGKLLQVNHYFTGAFSSAEKLTKLPTIPAIPQSSAGKIITLDYYLSAVYSGCDSAVELPSLPAVPDTAVNLKSANWYLSHALQKMNISRPEWAGDLVPALPSTANKLEYANNYLSDLFNLTVLATNGFPNLPALPAAADNIKSADNYLAGTFSMGLSHNLKYPELPALPASATGVLSANNYLGRIFYKSYGAKSFPALPKLPDTAQLRYADGYLKEAFHSAKNVTGVELPKIPTTAVNLKKINNYLAGTFNGSDISEISALPEIPAAAEIEEATNFLGATFANASKLSNPPEVLPALPSAMNADGYCVKTFENCPLLTADTISDISGLPVSITSFPANVTIDYAGGTTLVVEDTPMTDENFHQIFDAWSMPQTHLLILNSGNDVIDSETIYEGQTITISELQMPVRDYHTFGGWYTNKECTTHASDTITMGNADITLYAKWEPFPKHELRLSSNGAVTLIELYRTETVFLSVLNEEYEPTNGPEFHTFGGWYKDSACTTRCPDMIVMGNSNMIIYAKWVEDPKHNIIFNTDGGTNIASISLHEGETYADWENLSKTHKPSKPYHMFDGWYRDADCQIALTPITMGTEDINLFAKWIPFDQHNIILHSNNDFILIPLYETETREKSLLPIPTNGEKFRSFDGWYIDAEFTTVADTIIVMGEEDINLYAAWKEFPKHNVIFYTNGGNILAPKSLYETEILDLKKDAPIPTRTYYKFLTWCYDEGLTIPITTVTMGEHDIKIYAKWAPLEIKITFNTRGGEELPEEMFIMSDSVLLPIPTKAHHSFDGWYMDDEEPFDEPFDAAIVTNDIILYAKWIEGIRYGLVLNFCDEEPILLFEGQDIALSDIVIPEKEFHTFKGWYDDANFITKSADVITMGNKKINIYAKWEEFAKHNVTFFTFGGTTPSNIMLHETEKITADQLPTSTRNNYVFEDWYMDSDHINIVHDPLVMDKSDITLYAKWKLVAVTLVFDSMGGNDIAGITIEIEKEVDLPTPKKDGLVFAGWYLDGDFKTPFSFDMEHNDDELTLYAKYVTHDGKLPVPEEPQEPIVPVGPPPMEGDGSVWGDTATTVAASIGAMGSVMFGIAGTVLSFNRKKSIFGGNTPPMA